MGNVPTSVGNQTPWHLPSSGSQFGSTSGRVKKKAGYKFQSVETSGRDMHLWSAAAPKDAIFERREVNVTNRGDGRDMLSVIRYVTLATATVLHTDRRNFSEVCQKCRRCGGTRLRFALAV